MKKPQRGAVRRPAGRRRNGGSALDRVRREAPAVRVAPSAVATIRDVARAAGVSVATVSRVLNGSAPVREDTGRQVRTAAEKLNYWPNGAARSLITHRTGTIGVLLPDLHGEFFSEVIRGIDLASRRSGLHLLVSSSHAAIDELVAALRSMRGRIDGLVVMAPEAAAPRLVRECALGAPTVFINPGRTVRECDSVSIANFDGAHVIVRHLITLGHRRIAAVSGPDSNTDAAQRLAGYRAALRQAGLSVPRSFTLVGDFREPSGYDAGRRIVGLKPRPTAVFVSNDRMAVGVLGALGDAGLGVPHDMAVAGFDDIEVAQYLNPPLTTVHVDAFRLGERAFERLMLRLDAPDTEDDAHEVLPTTLVVRASCGARSGRAAGARVHRSEIMARSGNAASGRWAEPSGVSARTGKPQRGARR
jgi:LacI family transcriptional regulator